MRYEIEIMHDTVSKWFNQRGQKFDHELKMPLFGRADFVIYDHPFDHMNYIIECKKDCANIQATIAQLLGYIAQHIDGGYKGAIFVPKGTVTNEARYWCSKYGINLIPIQIPDPVEHLWKHVLVSESTVASLEKSEEFLIVANGQHS